RLHIHGRRPLRATLAFLACSLLVACSTTQYPCVWRDPDARRVVVAHRGVHTSAPENSLASVREAIALGVDMVELDVRTTRDGRLVLLHDETVDRTTDGSGRV